MSKKYGLLLLFLALPISAQMPFIKPIEVSAIQETVSQAITKFEQTKKDQWSYQVSRYENEEGNITSSIERFSPSLAQESPWSLIQINGEEPTEKQKKKFIEKKQEQAQNSALGAHYTMRLRELINLPSLQLITEDESHMHMSFNVYINRLGKDAKGKLQGRLSYNKQQQFIESIIIDNNAAFSPMFSANITHLTITLNFINIDNNVMPIRQDMDMKGTFAYFTEINETSTDIYSHYKNVELATVTSQ